MPTDFEVGDRCFCENTYWEINLQGTTKYWLAIDNINTLRTWSPQACKLNLAHCYSCRHTNAIEATYTNDYYE